MTLEEKIFQSVLKEPLTTRSGDVITAFLRDNKVFVSFNDQVRQFDTEHQAGMFLRNGMYQDWDIV